MTTNSSAERRLENLPDLLTVAETARYLGVSIGLARAAIVRGDIAVRRVGRRILVPRWALEELVHGERVCDDR